MNGVIVESARQLQWMRRLASIRSGHSPGGICLYDLRLRKRERLNV
jgi:hypothetical protein